MPDPTFTEPPINPSRSDAPSVFVARADAFVAWFSTLYAELLVFIAWVNEKVADIALLIQNTGYSATSTTSLALGTGTKSLTVQTGLAYGAGTVLLIADSAAPTTRLMVGPVTSYNSTTGALVVEVESFKGSGSYSAWVLSLTGSTASVTSGSIAAALGFTPQDAAQKGAASGLATLDSGTKVPAAQLNRAVASDVRALTSDEKLITPDSVADAMVPANLVDASTVAVDLEAGPNFELLLTTAVGGTRVLGAPTNTKPGSSGVILVRQPASGGPCALTYNAAWKPFGTAPVLSTAANAVDLIAYYVQSSSSIRFSFAKGGAA